MLSCCILRTKLTKKHLSNGTALSRSAFDTESGCGKLPMIPNGLGLTLMRMALELALHNPVCAVGSFFFGHQLGGIQNCYSTVIQ